MVDRSKTSVVVDSFTQTDKLEELDVLIVLDTSGSMSDNYADVADGMELLRSDIESLTIDYQFGYITMDPTVDDFVGPYDASASAIDMLMAPSLLPNTFYEEGFAATYNFLNSQDIYQFRRPDADFLLFLISDEDEQSSISAQLFYEWLNEEFEDVRHDVVCITNPDDGSGSSWSYEIGYKYIELANMYGKSEIDISDESWSIWLSNSSFLTSRRDSIELSQTPIPESIVVYIDGEPIYEWEYKEENNTVYLNTIPDYGSLVEVGYKVDAN